jgi:ribosomal protein L37AE/L43A
MQKQILQQVCPACGSKDYEHSDQGNYNKCRQCKFIWDESFHIPSSAIVQNVKKTKKENGGMRSVYDASEKMDAEIEDDGIIEDELGL